MSNKTATQVAADSLAAQWVSRDGTIQQQADEIVNALRSAGFITEPHNQCVPLHEMKKLERERDEAQNVRDQYEARMRAAEDGYDEMRKDCDNARRDAALLRATQSSPEVLAVVEAAKAWATVARPAYAHTNSPHAKLIAAVDALAASQRKAEPKPRYEVVASSGGWPEGGCVRSVATQELVFGVWRTGTPQEHAARCRSECDALNSADAAGRKS